jgi:hypothetical protein
MNDEEKEFLEQAALHGQRIALQLMARLEAAKVAVEGQGIRRSKAGVSQHRK